MIRASTFGGKRVAVFGLGGSGSATVVSLLAGGAEVAAWDDGERARQAAAKAGIPLVDLNGADWSAFAALVLAPGVPLTHPEPHWTVKAARAAGIEVIGDIEIFCRERRAHAPGSPFIAITGTNGKSTTTALIAHLLRSAGLRVEMGGNIGVPILSLEPPTPGDDESGQRKAPEGTRVHVVEMSSFQIDLTPSLDPTVGVLLNVSPDHLDRHGPADDPAGAMRNYAAIKERLLRGSQAAAVGIDDAISREMLERLEDEGAATYPFTTGKGAAAIPRLYAIGSTLFVHEKHEGYAASTEIASLDGIGTLRGRHNTQNALAALTALRALQDHLDAKGEGERSGALLVWRLPVLAAALRTYPGLPHRMEEVGRSGRILFINDSKATNADSTEKALASWSRDIFWILGGKPKEGGIRPLEGYFPRVAKAYLIGQASNDFAETLEGKVPHERCGTLDVALATAAADAARSAGPEPVVLLSPACASYDQFRSFEHRGDTFRALVRAMPGMTAPKAAS
jgi:UDP-N-acetylmuramoylalanine--D-glutamate ligase